MATADEPSPRDAVLAVARTVATRGWSLAGTGVQVLGGGVDDALRALVAGRVRRALRPGAPEVTTEDLVSALGAGPAKVPPWLGAGIARFARTGQAAKVLGGRAPVGLALTFGPALYGAVSGNLTGLDAAISRLVTRARSVGIEPDAERIARVVVQALTGASVDPGVEADHGGLLRLWLGDAGRPVVPFGDRISGLRRGPTPAAVAAMLDSVPVEALRGQPR